MFSSKSRYKRLINTFLVKNWKENVWKKVEENYDSNFFLDEVPNAVGSDELNLLSEKVAENKYLWAACQSHLPPSKISLKGRISQFEIWQQIKEMNPINNVKNIFFHFS
jgi:hypothetical protein